MIKYELHVSMPSTKINVVVFASTFVASEGRINFYNLRGDLICSYPEQYTIIEKIT